MNNSGRLILLKTPPLTKALDVKIDIFDGINNYYFEKSRISLSRGCWVLLSEHKKKHGRRLIF